MCCAVLQNVSHQKVRLFGGAFAKIQEATGISNIDELVKAFATAEVSSGMHGQGFKGCAALLQLACKSCADSRALWPMTGIVGPYIL